MKKSALVFVMAVFTAALICGNGFISISKVMEQEPGTLVCFKGKLLEADFTGQFLTVRDDTATIKVDIHTENIGYYGYDNLGVGIKVWGYVENDKGEIYIKARRLQIAGHFYNTDQFSSSMDF